jgi:hypothetical protein
MIIPYSRLSHFPSVENLPHAYRVPLDYGAHPGVREPATIYSRKEVVSTPAVTVVTPFYNTEDFLDETTHSIFNQSLQQFEWLIVDDGSDTPEALAAINRIAESDSRVRIVRHETNKGLSAARNTGIKEAKSDYVVFVDSDDSIEFTSLEKLLWKMHTNPDLGFARGYSVGFAAEKYVMIGGFYLGSVFLKDNLASNTGVMLRKSLVEQVGGYNEDRKTGLEDWEFWLKCAAAGIWGDNIEECVDWYRRRETHTDRWPDYSIDSRPRFFAQMKERFPELWANPDMFFRTHSSQAESNEKDLRSPCDNALAAKRGTVLIIADRMAGDEGVLLLNLVKECKRNGLDVIIAAVKGKHHPLAPQFYALTTDVFALPLFLDEAWFPSFILYLKSSRGVAAIYEYTHHPVVALLGETGCSRKHIDLFSYHRPGETPATRKAAETTGNGHAMECRRF